MERERREAPKVLKRSRGGGRVGQKAENGQGGEKARGAKRIEALSGV